MKNVLLAACFAACGAAQAQSPGGTQAPVAESHDFGVPPSAELRLQDFSSETPLAIPGAKTIGTAELRARLEDPPERRPLLFDVLGYDAQHRSLPGAIWLPDAGRGRSFDDALQAQLGRALELATKGERARPLVFFCAGVRCWLSYNAALRAARLGYTEVYWYRGGITAWLAAGGALSAPRVMWRSPVDR